MRRTWQVPATVILALTLVAPATVVGASSGVPVSESGRSTTTATGAMDSPASTAVSRGSLQPPQAASTAVRRTTRKPQPPQAASAVIVKFRSAMPSTIRATSRGRAAVARVRALRSIGAEVVRPRAGQSVAEAVAELSADPAVEYAEPDAPIVEAGDPAAEPFLGQYQWALENDGGSCIDGIPCRAGVDIDATEAWPLATGAGVTVAVLDDGVDFSNPELQGQAWVNPGESGTDASGADKATNGVDDDGNGFVDDVNGVNLCGDAASGVLHVPGTDWHGSAVASVLAAAADGAGMVGVAPDARIMAVRWLEPACSTVSYAIDAIDYAIASGAHVINASWGTYEDSFALRDAIQRGADAGVLIVAAAGNEGSQLLLYPAAYDVPNVVSVAAIGPDGSLADFSSYGPTVDLAAPGLAILAIDVIDDGYGLVDGTSFAAPLVAGVAALVGQSHPELLEDPAVLGARLIGSGWRDAQTVSPITSSGRVVDARRALDFDAPAAPAWLTGEARKGQTLGRSSVPVRLSWPAATDDLAVDAYRVRYRATSTASWSTLTGWTTARSANASLTRGVAYDIELTTRDAGANTTSIVVPFRVALHQEGFATYHGRWRRTAWKSASGGHTRYATRAGSRAKFRITGRSVALVMPKARSNGRARVYVDGTYATTLKLHARSTHARRIVFQRSWPSTGTHTIKIVVVGTRGHPRVDLDAVIVGR